MSTLSKKECNMDGAAKAKFNFTAQTPMEVSFLKGTNILMSLKSKIFYSYCITHHIGESVVLTRRIDKNWFEGRVSSSLNDDM